MPLLIVRTSGIESRKFKFQTIRRRLPGTFNMAIIRGGETVRAALEHAAPWGTGDGGAPAGDALGPLVLSFKTDWVISSTHTRSIVYTTQPRKLRYVREGTGIYGPSGQRIVPRTKRALMWPNAAHPVRSVRGMRPNDFVTPTLLATRERVIADIQDAIREAIAGGV